MFDSSFITIPLILASMGLILATSSFISGLQLVKSNTIVELKIHRINGYLSMTLFLTLAVLAFAEEGFEWMRLVGWVSGFSVLCLKVTIVRKRSRAMKYLSWFGGTLILIWLYIVFIHIPL